MEGNSLSNLPTFGFQTQDHVAICDQLFKQILAYCLDTLLIICILHTDSAAVCMSCWKWRVVGLKYRLWSLVDIMPFIFGYLSYVINGFLSVESTINMVHPLPQISNLSIPFHIIFHQKRCQRTVRHLV